MIIWYIGLAVVRQDIANFISQRDGGVPAKPEDIYLTTGFILIKIYLFTFSLIIIILFLNYNKVQVVVLK
jgi:hypothetical protein